MNVIWHLRKQSKEKKKSLFSISLLRKVWFMVAIYKNWLRGSTAEYSIEVVHPALKLWCSYKLINIVECPGRNNSLKS